MHNRQMESYFSAGWYRFAASSKIKKGRIHTFNYFEKSFVCIRNAHQIVSVFDAYCPHLGAHLGGGKIENGLLICPFHGWKYDGAGKCVEIPYCKKIPKRAFLPSYPVKEVNSFIYFYFAHDLVEQKAVEAKEIEIFYERNFKEFFTIHLELQKFHKVMAKANSTFFNFKLHSPGFFISEVKKHTTNVCFLIAATPINQSTLSVSFSASFQKTFNLFQTIYEKRKAEQRIKNLLYATEIL